MSLGAYGVIAYLVFTWARWLRWRTQVPRWASWLAYAFLGLVVLVPVWVVLSVFGAVSGESVDPSGRALAINLDIDLMFVAQALAPLVLAVLWLLVSTWRWHWAVRGAVVPGDPPYR